MKPLRSLLLLCLLATAFAGRQYATYDLLWKPKTGDILKYKLSMEMDMDDQKAKFTSKLKLEVVKVADNGDYDLKTSTTESKATIGDHEETIPDDDPTVEKYNAKGEKISEDKDEEADDDPISEVIGPVTDFTTPDMPVKKGDTWSKNIKADEKLKQKAAEIKYELVGQEKSEAFEVLRIKFTYKQTEGDNNVTADGSFLVDAKDFSLVNLDVSIDNLKMDESAPAGKATFKMSRDTETQTHTLSFRP